MVDLLLNSSSVADKARLLSVSSPHTAYWLSVVLSESLGLHMDPPVFQVGGLVLILLTAPNVHCVLVVLHLITLATMQLQASMVLSFFFIIIISNHINYTNATITKHKSQNNIQTQMYS